MIRDRAAWRRHRDAERSPLRLSGEPFVDVQME